MAIGVWTPVLSESQGRSIWTAALSICRQRSDRKVRGALGKARFGMTIPGRVHLEALLCRTQILFDPKRISLPLDSAVTVSLCILFPFEALGVSLQSFLHERWINTEVGPFKFLNHFRKMEQMTLRGGFQHAQRARHDKTALHPPWRRLSTPSTRADVADYFAERPPSRAQTESESQSFTTASGPS